MPRKVVSEVRTLSYVNFLKSTPQVCDNLVLMCMDFRFHKQISDLVSYAGYRDFNIMALPGASKAVLNDVSRDAVLSAVRLVIDAHGVKRVIIVDHVDCRAYGGSEAFADPSSEEQTHEEALQQAAAILRDSFPGLEVVQVYADWDKVKQIS